MVTKEQILKQLRPIIDPELRIGIVDLGLIYGIDIDENSNVHVKMTLTSPMCPVGPELTSAVEIALMELKEVNKVEVELVFDPPYNPEEMASDFAKDQLGIW